MNALILFSSMILVVAYGTSFSSAIEAEKKNDLRVLPLWFLSEANPLSILLHFSYFFATALFISLLVWGFLTIRWWVVLAEIPPAILVGALFSHHKRPVFIVCLTGFLSLISAIGVWLLPKVG